MTVGFLSGSKNFCKLLWVSCEVLFYTDTSGSIGWPSPAPRLHVDDCFEIHNLHSEPCDLLLSSHQNCLREVRLRHCVFCTGALVILVLWQISQFRSLGKWVWTLCLPKSSRLLNMGSKDASRENLRVQKLHHPPNFPWILATTPGFPNLRDLSRQTTGCPVLSWFPFYLFFWKFLVGLVHNGSSRSIRSTCELDTGTGWESIPLRSSLFSSLTVA